MLQAASQEDQRLLLLPSALFLKQGVTERSEPLSLSSAPQPWLRDFFSPKIDTNLKPNNL